MFAIKTPQSSPVSTSSQTINSRYRINPRTQSVEYKHTASQPRIWVITGASAGFGRELVPAILAHGDKVIATARNPAKLESNGVHTLKLDVTDTLPRDSGDRQGSRCRLRPRRRSRQQCWLFPNG